MVNENTDTTSDEAIDDLRHQIDILKNQIDNAHAWLDILGIPRTAPGVNTVYGRLELIADIAPKEFIALRNMCWERNR